MLPERWRHCVLRNLSLICVYLLNSWEGLRAALKITTIEGTKAYSEEDIQQNVLKQAQGDLEIEVTGRFIVQFRASSEKT